jgi:hypothetical protein
VGINVIKTVNAFMRDDVNKYKILGKSSTDLLFLGLCAAAGPEGWIVGVGYCLLEYHGTSDRAWGLK